MNRFLPNFLPFFSALLAGTFLFFAFRKSVLEENPLFPLWNPDAGLIPSFTDNAIVSASSNTSEATKILDGDPSTAWQSEAPLPEGFIRRPDLNVFLEQKAFPTGAVDGNLTTSVELSSGFSESDAMHVFGLEKQSSLFSISMKAQVKAPVAIQIKTSSGGLKSLGNYLPENNFTLQRFTLAGSEPVKEIVFRSTQSFSLFEIAALAEPPKEFVVVDLGKFRPVGTIHTRHWAGENAAMETNIFLSKDSLDWKKMSSPDPNVLHTVITNVYPEVLARYVKIEHVLQPRDWTKVFFWEMKVYDHHGYFGERLLSQPSPVNIRELLGVNAYWSWGTDQHSNELSEKEGPKLYRPVASHARNYHDTRWDVSAPGEKVDYREMAKGKGTRVQAWLDWDKEYKAWMDAGLNVQVSLMFDHFTPSDWKNPEQEAFNYAYNFARHFGRRNGNGYVCTIEAGNEPWKYDAATYQKILSGMAKGAEAGDPTIEIFPCALQAADPAAEQSDVFKNYVGARITRESAALLDGLNVHAYSWATDKAGKRKAVHPEHPNSSFWEILNMIRWRNHNMPGKKIYLSEWGWDCSGGGEDCSHDECESEQAAANYAIRGALIAARLGLDRATWFFYANEKKPSSLFSRSGLTGSVETGFKKKMVFHALESLVKLAGDKYFLLAVQEDETAWMYLLGDANGKATHLVAWRPVDGEDQSVQSVIWKTGREAVSAVWLDGKTSAGTTVQKPERIKGGIALRLSSTPLLVKLK